MSLTNIVGKHSPYLSERTLEPGKTPDQKVLFTGTAAQCEYSQSIYLMYGWKSTVNYNGDNSVMTSTLKSIIGSDGITPINPTGSISGSGITVNYSFKVNSSTKDLLHVDSSSIGWINTIDAVDKGTVAKFIANPPTLDWESYVAHGLNPGPGSCTAGDQGINWSRTDVTSAFYNSSAYSINGCQVLWAMLNNGFKDMDVLQPVIRASYVVPSNFQVSIFNNNIGRIYHKTTVKSELGLPDNWFALMRQDTDPVGIPVASGGTIPMIFGWKKLPINPVGNGSVINLDVEYVYGLYYQNVFQPRL